MGTWNGKRTTLEEIDRMTLLVFVRTSFARTCTKTTCVEVSVRGLWGRRAARPGRLERPPLDTDPFRLGFQFCLLPPMNADDLDSVQKVVTPYRERRGEARPPPGRVKPLPQMVSTPVGSQFCTRIGRIHAMKGLLIRGEMPQ